MRIGVLGCGVIAYWAHLRVLRRMPGATLAAAADPDPAARALARSLTGVELHERSEDLLRRTDIDAVVICAPTQLHADLAVAAADAGQAFLPGETHRHRRRWCEARGGCGGRRRRDRGDRLQPPATSTLPAGARPSRCRPHRTGARGADGTLRADAGGEHAQVEAERASGGGVLLELASITWTCFAGSSGTRWKRSPRRSARRSPSRTPPNSR